MIYFTEQATSGSSEPTGRRDEIEVTHEMIASLFETEMHWGDDSEKRLLDAASFFAAIFLALPPSLRGEAKSIRVGTLVCRIPQGD
jgi:hypothetical protein